MEFLSKEDYLAAPDDPEQKFSYLAERCRKRIMGVSGSAPNHLDDAYKQEYLAIIRGLAAELNIKGIPVNSSAPVSNQFLNMLAATSAITNKVLLRTTSAEGGDTVRLAASTRAEIERKITRLRVYIEQADMPAGKRNELLKKLEELQAALTEGRVSMSTTLIVLSSIVLGVTTFLAEVPDALKTATSIIAMVAKDKEAENVERERLESPARPLAIEDKRSADEE